MKVNLVTDGRDFDGEDAVYEPGDVAWFEEDVLLVTKVENGEAFAVVHPAAVEMLRSLLDHPKGVRVGIDEAMRIHARTMARGYLAAIEFAKAAGASVEVSFVGAEADALRTLRDELEAAQGLARPDLHIYDVYGAEEEMVIAESEEKAREFMLTMAPAEDLADAVFREYDDDEPVTLRVEGEPITKKAKEWCRQGFGYFASCYA